MANEFEAEWNEFRRYKFKGVRIEDRKGFIRFSQRVNIYDQRATWPILTVRVLGGAVWLIPTVILGIKSGAFAAILYFLAACIPVGLVMWLAYIIFRDRMGVDIYPGRIVLKEGRRETHVRLEDIQNIDVRTTANGSYGVYVWNRKIPVLILFQVVEYQAISLREGIILAMEVMNNQDVVAEEHTPQEAVRGRTFDE